MLNNTLYNHTAQIRKEFLNISNKIDALQNKVMTIKSSNSTDSNTIPIGTAIELRVSDGYVQWKATDGTWNNLISIAELQGSDGQDGTDGTNGIDGADGSDGANGVGVPTGGTTGQVLAKASNDDYDTEWTDAGSGGGASILADLTDVNVGTPSNGQVLSWDSTTNKWIPITVVVTAAVLLLSLTVDNWWGLEVFNFSSNTIVLAE